MGSSAGGTGVAGTDLNRVDHLLTCERSDAMRILCATDLLPKSDAAIERAGVLADHLGADLMMLHIVSPDGAQGTLEERLQNGLPQITARTRPPSWTAHCAPRLGILPGNPTRMILDAVEESK